MQTNYHSQFDNDGYYDEDVYRMHHELFGLLLMAIDKTAVVPLSFAGVMKKAEECLSDEWCEKCGVDRDGFVKALRKAAKAGDKAYEKVLEANREYARYSAAAQNDAGDKEENPVAKAEALYENNRNLEKGLLRAFQKVQDTFVRIDWHGMVLFPQEILQEHLTLLDGAIGNLKEGKISAALRKLYEMDNNSYAFAFDKEVYEYFTRNSLNQPKDRLKWGYGRIIGHEDLFDVVEALIGKTDADCSKEITFLQEAYERQVELFRNEITEMKNKTEEIAGILREF